MKNYKGLYRNNLINRMRLNFNKFQYSIMIDEKNSNDNGTKKKKKSEELDLDEYDFKEFDRSIDDPTDKMKPFDNFHTKVSRPDLWEQYEKRKDIFHTKDTSYLKNEKNSKSEGKNGKSDG